MATQRALPQPFGHNHTVTVKLTITIESICLTAKRLLVVNVQDGLVTCTCKVLSIKRLLVCRLAILYVIFVHFGISVVYLCFLYTINLKKSSF